MREKRDKKEGTPSQGLIRLGARSSRELEAMLLRGETPDPEKMVGWEYRGLNTPSFARLLGIKKFIKGFYKDDSGRFFGYNIAAAQGLTLNAPWTYRGGGRPRRFGFFAVTPVDPESRDNGYLHAQLLDYARGGNAIYDPTNVVRDYLVRVDRGSDDLLIGKAFVAAGPLRVAVSYFLLERHLKTDFRR
jgi:hypothetical protein